MNKKKNLIIIGLCVILIVGFNGIIFLTNLQIGEKINEGTSTTTKENIEEYVGQDLPELVLDQNEKAYLTYNIKGDFYYKPSNQFHIDLINIINEIKDYNIIKEEGSYLAPFYNETFETLSIIYCIGRIETNLNFQFQFKDNKLDKLIVSGVKRNNLNKVEKTNEEKLIELVDNFNVDDFLASKNIDRKKEPALKEIFSYDYNTQELIYDYVREIGKDKIFKKIN